MTIIGQCICWIIRELNPSSAMQHALFFSTKGSNVNIKKGNAKFIICDVSLFLFCCWLHYIFHFFTYLKTGADLTKTKTFLQVWTKITQCLQESRYQYDPRAIHFSSIRFCQVLNPDEFN